MIRHSVISRADIDAATAESESMILRSERVDAARQPRWTESDPCEGTHEPGCCWQLPVVEYWPLRTRRDERGVRLLVWLAVTIVALMIVGTQMGVLR